MRFLQLPRALLAAHFNGPASDFHFDRVYIELAVTSRTGLCSHGIVSKGRTSSRASRPDTAKEPLSECLAIWSGDLATHCGLTEF
jgi:hypothetical protein